MSEWFEKSERIQSLGGIRSISGKPEVASAKDTLACSPHYGGCVEITITYPHSAAYLRMNADKQERLLREIFRRTCAAVPIHHHVDRQCYAEFDRNGQRHIHGYLIINSDYRAFPIGIISDMAKACLAEYPKKYSRFITANVYNEYCSYRCPQCKIKYRYKDDTEDTERFKEWQVYCNKLQ